MARYVDKDAIINKIKEKRDAALMRQHNLEKIGQETIVNEQVAFSLDTILSFIDTLDTLDVNLSNIDKRVQYASTDAAIKSKVIEKVLEACKKLYNAELALCEPAAPQSWKDEAKSAWEEFVWRWQDYELVSEDSMNIKTDELNYDDYGVN